MKPVIRVTLVFSSLCFFASADFAQNTSAVAQQPAVPPPAQQIACQTTVGPIRGTAVSGTTAPYSAMREYTFVQTLADGTHITRTPPPERIYRDSQGRLRTERAICQGAAENPDRLLIEIRDPVAGYAYILETQNHIAHRYALQVRQPGAPPAPAVRTNITELKSAVTVQEPSGPKRTTEPLGSETIEGLPADGTRTTEIIPAGLEGNDRPITVVRESWVSSDLRVAILTKDSDPRNGEGTSRLTNIELSQPSLTLFQPPPDYKIVDETERVTLTFTRN
jgi:hypothetical protein